MIDQTPWVTRKFNFDFPVGLFPVIYTRLEGTIFRLEQMVRNVPGEILSHRSNGHWSVKEIIGHLYDLESLWDQRISDFLSGKTVLQAADMTNAKTHEANHQAKEIDELLAQFFTARRSLLSRISDFDEKTASTTALHPRLQTPMRLVDSLFFAAEHDDHELTKIRLILNP